MRDATAAMVLGEVAARLAKLAVAERSAEILGESRDLLALMVEQSSARYAVGEAEQQDVLRAAQERSGSNERLALVEQRRVAARAALAALLTPSSASPPGWRASTRWPRPQSGSSRSTAES